MRKRKVAESGILLHSVGMKYFTTLLGVVAFCFSGQLVQASLLENEPDVVHFDQGDTITLLVVNESAVYASKKGSASRKLGTYPVDTQLVLLGMTENAYKVKGKAKHSVVTGWVSPKNLASTRPDFVEELKSFYKREIAIRELISNEEVAIGMTIEEVQQSIGEPTKKESRVTKDGRSGKWEFIKGKEQKHYTNTVDPRTGQIFRRFSHVTIEEQENLTVEFENDVVTAISNKENNSIGNVKIVVPPVIFAY